MMCGGPYLWLLLAAGVDLLGIVIHSSPLRQRGRRRAKSGHRRSRVWGRWRTHPSTPTRVRVTAEVARDEWRGPSLYVRSSLRYLYGTCIVNVIIRQIPMVLIVFRGREAVWSVFLRVEGRCSGAIGR